MNHKKLFLRLSLVLSLLALSATALWANPNPAPSPKPPVTFADEALNLLPAADAIVVIDGARVMNDLMPQIRAIAPSIEKDINDFINKTGIDPYKIKSAVVGVNMSGKDTQLAAIIQGISFDPARVGAALADKKEEIKTVEYKGKQLYVITPKQASKAGIEEEMAYTQLDGDRVALGTLGQVKTMLDGGSGNGNGKLGEMLDKITSGVIRFAVNVPASAVKGLTDQGDLFKQFSTIKSIFGALDLAADLSATLDAKMRTATSDEASKLQTSLAGLVGLGKMFLGGNDDPQMKMINELLDTIKIGAQDTDVSLSVIVPRKTFDAFAEMNKKKATDKDKNK